MVVTAAELTWTVSHGVEKSTEVVSHLFVERKEQGTGDSEHEKLNVLKHKHFEGKSKYFLSFQKIITPSGILASLQSPRSQSHET